MSSSIAHGDVLGAIVSWGVISVVWEENVVGVVVIYAMEQVDAILHDDRPLVGTFCVGEVFCALARLYVYQSPAHQPDLHP